MSEQKQHSDKLIALLPEVAKCGMQTFDRLITLAQCAFDVAHLPGDICEFGCNAGSTARWLRELLPDKHLWLYDTFTGHPKDDVSFKQGDMAACAPTDISRSTVVTGNILELSEASTDVPQTIILAHVDLDTYEGTLHALNLIWPRMSPFGHIVVDDYYDERFPGVMQAVNDFRTYTARVKMETSYGCAGKHRTSVVIH